MKTRIVNLKNVSCEAESRRSASWVSFCLFAMAILQLTVSPALAKTRHLTPGEAAAPFLKVPTSARAAALGDAFVGWGRDAAVVEYNPAGVSAMGGVHLTAGQIISFQDSAFSALSVAGSRGRVGAGFHYRQFSAEDEARDSVGTRNGDIEHKEYAMQGALGVRFGRRLGLGLGGKVIGRRVERTGSGAAAGDFDADSRSMAWDAGLLWALVRGGAFGLAIQNVGQGIQGEVSGKSGALLPVTGRGARQALPQLIRLGGTHPVGPIAFSWELDQPRDNRPSASAGAELYVRSWFLLRGGLRYQRFVEPSAGLGFSWDHFNFDYSFSPRVDIGNAHRATVGIRF